MFYKSLIESSDVSIESIQAVKMSLNNHQGCSPEDPDEIPSTSEIFNISLVTIISLLIFVTVKTGFDRFKQKRSHMTLVVIGSGPIGLLSAIIGIKTGRVVNVIIYEEQNCTVLFNKPHQIGLDHQSVQFLGKLGVDFDNIEGCWKNGCFFTRIGVFIEYLLNLVKSFRVPVLIKLNKKFTEESMKELDNIEGRVVVISCDGEQGTSSAILGLSDEFTQHSCKAYGSVATVEQQNVRSVPASEIRVHNVTFNLNAFNKDFSFSHINNNNYSPAVGFHFKLFGSKRQRYLALAAPCCEAKYIKALTTVHDRSVMRNIFQVCYNKFKSPEESLMSDRTALRCLKFIPRLFEIKLAQRQECVCYYEHEDMFVLVEGEVYSTLNFYTGMDINLAVQSLTSLAEFLHLAAIACNEHDVRKALLYKHQCNRNICRQFVNEGLNKYLFTG